MMKVERDRCWTIAGSVLSGTWEEHAMMWEVEYLLELTAKLPASSFEG